MGSEDKAPSMADEDHAIRERVRELTSQVLKHGRVDTEAVRDVVRAVTGGVTENPISGDDPGDSFADAVRVLGETVQRSASATHDALQQLASRGSAFTDNDLKEALTSLRALEEAYVAAASRISNAMTGNLRREVVGLATHAQGIGTEAQRSTSQSDGRVREPNGNCRIWLGHSAWCGCAYGSACQRCTGRHCGRPPRST